MTEASQKLDLIIVGAGFGGMYMLHRARQQGLTAKVLEAGSDVGGTWYWNRYPGARCDVESLEYSYQFDEALQQDWQWSERYAPQPEILAYCQHVAERFDLRRDMEFHTRVASAHFDEGERRWAVTAEDGRSWEAQFVVMATGCLSMPNIPDIAGADAYTGPIYHTGRWPKEGVDFTGKRVAVIGTGSSGIQSIPLIAKQAKSLTVFQRTPNHSVPAQNKPLDRTLEKAVKANYADLRARNAQELVGFGARHPTNQGSVLEASPEERQAQFEYHWQLGGLLFMRAFGDTGLTTEANEYAAEFIRGKIKEKVKDPETARKLLPDTAVGCKRLCADSGYFETFNEPHVQLVDLRETPLKGLYADGVETEGAQFEVDAVVFATGFDAMTGALARIDIRGRNGQALTEAWAEGPKSYLGLQVVGFPNLFTVTGPGSPSVLTNMLPSIEQHVRFIGDAIADLKAAGYATMEAEPEAQDAWVGHVNEVGDATIYPTCNSWYVGANIPGKPRVFMPYLGFPAYCEKCDAVRAAGYEGFHRAA